MALTAALVQYAGSSTTASTSDSGGETSASVSGHSSSLVRPGPALRTVLCRRHGTRALGFSLRGGREHGTGFFVSAVERGSEAYLQGLMVGDQIVRINGLPVEDATHREVLQLIQNQNSLTFKVRSVGMIPVKDSYSDSLTWRIVEPEPGGAPEPPDIKHNASQNVHMFINVAPKAKLGCGICKGPDWRPGIFVQFTKENSLARNAGLRPGDQIIQCNSVVFTPDTPFAEAVSVLKSTGLLELVIQKGAGLDLFPGESSGYNSSASSVAGDQSPDTWPNKRLSVVREESVIDLDSRLTGSDQSRMAGERHKDSDRTVPAPPTHGQFSIKPQTTDGACTVIRVGPDDSYAVNEPSTKLAEICMVSQQLETKTTTVLVEVHQSEDEDMANNQSDTSLCQLTNSSSVSSYSSSANSLCSAISQELQRRVEKRAKDNSCGIKPTSKVELHKCGMDKEKVEQHQKLMEEFRRAHKKMFAHSLNQDNKTDPSRPCPLATQSLEERESFRLKRLQKEERHAANMNQEKVLVAVKERDLRLERDKQDMTEADRELTRLVRRQQNGIPPPPPPPANGVDQVDHVPPAQSNLPSLPPSPPDCPTPDYDKESLSSEASSKVTTSCNKTAPARNGSADFVEMQSLESFKLTNPSVSKPKPPPIYFQPNMNGSITSNTSSVSEVKPTIVIREYPTNTERKNPERFQFLSQNPAGQVSHYQSGEPIAARLQDELSQTLSKANLKCDSNGVENTQTSHTNGKSTVTISINAQPNYQMKKENNTSQPAKHAPFYLHKSENVNNNLNNSNDVPRKISTTTLNQKPTMRNEIITGKNCVSFNLGHSQDKPETRTVTVLQPNGILKNGLGGSVAALQINPSQQNKSPSKSIKFAGVTTAGSQEPKK